LSGDTGQHASVARGDALRILERHSNFKSGQLTAIRRQRKAAYRKAVELAAQKRTIEAFAQLERMGAVAEVLADGHHDLHDSAAKSYLKALAENKSALLVAPTWNEIEAVTEKIRTALKTSGRLAGEEKEFQVFVSLSWTEAQKRDAGQYRPGMAIHFHRRGHGFNKNETVAVVAVENDSLKVQRSDGTETFFPLGQGSALCDVGERSKLKIAAGDKLLLQANAVAVRKHFINGELVEVRTIQGDSVLLADGRVIPADYRTFTHGYAVTSHAAQGKTVDEVLLVASSRSLPAINQEQFYVSISRGRERCQIFTDDSELLRSHITHSSARLAAVEAMPQRDFLQTILQRGNRFMKRFRQRLARSLSIETTERSSHEIQSNKQQRTTARHIRV
jgi:ATP-dependent exoDNAse (exonuclease V) alpha subunit